MASFHDLVVKQWSARFQGITYPCAIGRGGIGNKTGEGDGITPGGVFRLAGFMYRPDRITPRFSQLEGRKIATQDCWSDDPRDLNYNHLIPGPVSEFSHETLRRSDPLYDLIGVLDYNWPDAIPGAGSAIFLHVWRKPRHPTEGCIAFAPEVLGHILGNWRRRSRVIID